MTSGLGAGVRRWVIASVAVPLGAKTLDSIAGRLERAEGRKSVLSRGLRTASKVAQREKSPQREKSTTRREDTGRTRN